jgi:hypothetical protein
VVGERHEHGLVPQEIDPLERFGISRFGVFEVLKDHAVSVDRHNPAVADPEHHTSSIMLMVVINASGIFRF